MISKLNKNNTQYSLYVHMLYIKFETLIFLFNILIFQRNKITPTEHLFLYNKTIWVRQNYSFRYIVNNVQQNLEEWRVGYIQVDDEKTVLRIWWKLLNINRNNIHATRISFGCTQLKSQHFNSLWELYFITTLYFHINWSDN